MQKQYSQQKALAAITKASLKAILKNPGAIFFSLVFPLVFVWIFGSLGNNTMVKYKVAISQNTDTSNAMYTAIAYSPIIEVKRFANEFEQKQELEKGKLTAIIKINVTTDSLKQQHCKVQLTSTNASAPELNMLMILLENIASKLYPNVSNPVQITKKMYEVRSYQSIDFVLPGQIGFSILFSTLFGIAFTFYNLREQLVLKRFYASPVNRLSILVGIGVSRLLFQLLNVIVLIIVGKIFLGFTLAHGFITFIEIIALSVLMLMTLMGVGLIFSSIAKTDSMIPLLINLFALPQILLSGTFFSINVFPTWMQTACNFLPLTHFNSAMRKISFEGAGMIDCWQNFLVIGIWAIVIYCIVYKIFKWE